MASTSRMKRSSDSPALDSCTKIKSAANFLTTLVQENPSSPHVLTKALTITASSELKCSSEEKAALSELDDDFEKAVGTIKSAVKDIQEKLLTLTGSTASPEVIEAVTTPAPQSKLFII